MIITRYQHLVFLQGDEALPIIKMIDKIGEDFTLNHLLNNYVNSDKCILLVKSPVGFKDRIYKVAPFVLSYNPHIPYVGLHK